MAQKHFVSISELSEQDWSQFISLVLCPGTDVCIIYTRVCHIMVENPPSAISMLWFNIYFYSGLDYLLDYSTKLKQLLQLHHIIAWGHSLLFSRFVHLNESRSKQNSNHNHHCKVQSLRELSPVSLHQRLQYYHRNKWLFSGVSSWRVIKTDMTGLARL